MKKLLIILLAALLLVSFTSCNQDKIDELEKKVAEQEKEKETLTKEKETLTEEKETLTEEKETLEKDQEAMLKTFEDFAKAYGLERIIYYAYTDGENGAAGVISFSSFTGDINVTLSSTVKPYFTYIDNLVALGENEGVDTISVKDDASGTITGTITGTGYDDYAESLTFTDNSFTIVYDIENTKDSTKNKKDQELPMTLSGTYSISEKDNVKKVSFKMTLNNTLYDITYEMNSMNEKFISAKINGTDVSLRLLNAGY